MKLKEWVEKIIKNAQNKDLSKGDKIFVIKENLKAFVQDVEVVGLALEGNKIYPYVIE